MRIFSKLVFICNVCFVISVWMRFVELSAKASGSSDRIIKLQPVENTLILLGYGAIFLNLLFVITVCFRLLLHKPVRPLWITIFNSAMLLVQLYYFFIYR